MPFLERTPFGLRALFLWDPVWDAWRADPHFHDLLAKLNYTAEYATFLAHSAVGATLFGVTPPGMCWSTRVAPPRQLAHGGLDGAPWRPTPASEIRPALFSRNTRAAGIIGPLVNFQHKGKSRMVQLPVDAVFRIRPVDDFEPLKSREIFARHPGLLQFLHPDISDI